MNKILTFKYSVAEALGIFGSEKNGKNVSVKEIKVCELAGENGKTLKEMERKNSISKIPQNITEIPQNITEILQNITEIPQNITEILQNIRKTCASYHLIYC